MKKYKLIKDYPFAPCEVGDIFEDPYNGRYDLYPEFWQEVKEPLFVTNDGIEIFDRNETIYEVSEKYVIYETIGDYDRSLNRKYFSIRNTAEQWIEQNKPVFSRKQVLDALDNSYYANFSLTKFKEELGL